MRDFITLITVAGLAILPLASAWNVAFYGSGTTKCDAEDSSFTYAVYSGSGQGDCVLVGEPKDNCQWFWNAGFDSDVCTKAFSAPPGAVSILDGTVCGIFEDSQCTNSLKQSNGGNQWSGPACIKISGSIVPYFRCWDG